MPLSNSLACVNKRKKVFHIYLVMVGILRHSVGGSFFIPLLNLFSVYQKIIVSLHVLFAGLQMPAEGDSNLNINTFMGLGDGPRGCGKVIENNKKQ